MSVATPTHQACANLVAALGRYATLYTAAAGLNGANEATGSPYTRVLSATYTPDGNGNTASTQINVPCPAGNYVEAGMASTLSGAQLSAPSGLNISPASGGSLTTGSPVYYKITAFNWSGETVGSAELSITPSGGNLAATLSWSAVAGVSDQTGIAAIFAGFNVYRGTTSGGENVLVATLAATATSYTDTGAAGTSESPPGSNTAATFVGSNAIIGGTVTVIGTNASINLVPNTSG
jgi:hypothetical protein